MSTTKDQQKLVAKKFFSWLKEKDISINEAATKFGVNPNALSNWKNRGIPPERYKTASDMMAIPLDVLVASEGELELVTGKVKMLPLINEVHAGSWTGVGDSTFEEYCPVAVSCSKDSFCLRVRGNSMDPVFQDGDIVAVDPAIKASAGKYVVANKGEEAEATVKKYRALGLDSRGEEIFELVPLNSDFASYRSDQVNIRIVGVVFSVIRSV